MDDHSGEAEDPTRNKMIDYAKTFLENLEKIQSGGEPALPTDCVGTSASSTTVVDESSVPRTFQEVYDSFIDHRFGPNAPKKRKRSTKNCYNSAWLKLEPFYNLTLDQVDVDTLESRVNLVASWGYSKTTVTRVVTLIHQLYKYAFDRGYCKSRHGLGVETPDAKEEVHHQDFTDEEIDKLWEVYHTHSATGEEGSSLVLDTVRMILIMVYSGFRIKEYETLEFVDGDVPYFKGGLKTAAGKNRVVPVHSKIIDLVREINGVFLNGKKNGQFRRDMKKVLVEIGVDDPGGCHKKASPHTETGDIHTEDICVLAADDGVEGRTEGVEDQIVGVEECIHNESEAADNVAEVTARRYHTPHSTRHTFSRLCESYDVKEADRKRMLGHSLKGDITNGVYGHRSVEELRKEIEKISICII